MAASYPTFRCKFLLYSMLQTNMKGLNQDLPQKISEETVGLNLHLIYCNTLRSEQYAISPIKDSNRLRQFFQSCILPAGLYVKNSGCKFGHFMQGLFSEKLIMTEMVYFLEYLPAALCSSYKFWLCLFVTTLFSQS